ncbi:MAG: universal stress protein [Acidobacteriia bacterium]|nr:universal stress protein [Terriglobia bacterium]
MFGTSTFSLKRILLPVDFSERCAAVVPMAAEFTRRFGAELTLLHMAPLFPDRVPDSLCSRLDAFRSDALGNITPDRRIVMSDRDPAADIADYAQRHATDLIMMPTHGYGPFRRFLFGSVTLKVLHDAQCAVWTTAHTEEQPDFRSIAFRNVLCAIDRSEQSCRLLKWAAQFADEYGAKLTIVHAIPSVSASYGRLNVPGWEEELAESPQFEIASLRDMLGIKAKIKVVPGDPAPAVRQAAEEEQADLLVIGRSRGDGLAGRLLTDTFPIIRLSPCPVVSV